MLNRMADPRLVRLCQIAIGLVFAWAALAKIGDPKAFAEQIHNFRIVPVAFENVVAFALPWIELVAALALVLGHHARAGAVLVFWLLAGFTLAVVAALARGLDFECGCFGTADATHVGWVKVLQNLAMLAVAGLGSLRRR